MPTCLGGLIKNFYLGMELWRKDCRLHVAIQLAHLLIWLSQKHKSHTRASLNIFFTNRPITLKLDWVSIREFKGLRCSRRI